MILEATNEHMGMVKRNTYKWEKKLEQEYPVHTGSGVIALLGNLDRVREDAYRGNYDALILILDVERLLGTLTERQYQVVDLVYYQDYDVDEAAEILGMHRNTVHWHIEYAAKKIAKQLAETEGYRATN